MTLLPNASSGGGAEATRAEMTGPEIKTGRSFWKFYAVLFLLLLAALVVVAAAMLGGSAENQVPPAGSGETVQAETPSAPDQTGPEPETPAPTVEPAPATEVSRENKDDGAPQSLLLAQNSAAEPVKIGDIYQDADGVWRNRPPLAANTVDSEFYQDANGVWHNRQPVQARLQTPNPNLDLGGILGQLMGAAGQPGAASSAPADIIGGLLSSGGLNLGGLLTSGSLEAGGGGDLLNAGSLEVLSNLLFNSAGGFDSLGLGTGSGLESGDLSGLFRIMETVLGASGGLAGPGGSRESAAPPRANVISSGSALRGLPPASSAPAATGGESGFSLDGYERFDPATAGRIESEWDYFDGSSVTGSSR